MWRKGKTVGETAAATVKKTMAVPQKTKNRTTIQSNKTHFWVYL